MGLEFDGKAKIGQPFDEAACLGFNAAAIEVSRAEIVIECAILEHVIGSSEDGRGDRADGFLRSPSTTQSEVLGVQVGAFAARGGPSNIEPAWPSAMVLLFVSESTRVCRHSVAARTQAGPGT
jgi:hypothetical protein